jgi:CRISPR-associated protein (TIGR02710 family)
MGINFPFTGRIRDIDNPYVYFGDIELGLIKKSFDNYDFSMVLEICEDLRKTVRDNDIYTLLEIIQEFAVVYRDCDMFMHSKHFGDQKSRKEYVILSSGLENAMNKIHRFRKNLKSDIVDHELMQKNIDFLKMLESGWKDRKNICDKYRLVDMYLNANRRAFQNRYDDATARLYRCMEMCSTIELEKYGIDDPAEPDYKMFADRLGMDLSDISSNFEKQMGRSLPPRLALGDQMILLGHIKNNVVAALYEKMAASKKADKNNPDSLMEKRNRSILAHGTNPISKEDYQQIESNVVSMINATIGKEEFDHLSSQAKFPKLNLV